MRISFLLIVLLITGCARHSSINQLYPEFTKRNVRSTQTLYLLEVTTDNQINHPDYEMLFDPPRYKPQGKLIEIPQGTELFITGFYEHNRFTESGTEVEGVVVLNGEKVKFFKTLNHAYNGVKKVDQLPWLAVQ